MKVKVADLKKNDWVPQYGQVVSVQPFFTDVAVKKDKGGDFPALKGSLLHARLAAQASEGIYDQELRSLRVTFTGGKHRSFAPDAEINITRVEQAA